MVPQVPYHFIYIYVNIYNILVTLQLIFCYSLVVYNIYCIIIEFDKTKNFIRPLLMVLLILIYLMLLYLK